MVSERREVGPPFHAGRVRRVFHTLVALAGWTLFVYWWWLVMRRVSRTEVVFTLLLVAAALVLIVLVTATWALHNLTIFERRGPRLHAREVADDLAHDRVGRALDLPALPDACRRAPVVTVSIHDGAKRYTVGAAGPGPAGGTT